MHHVIIGNGIAGVSAAFRIRQNDPDARITMISGESTYHYARPALMYVFMGHMRYRDTKPYEDRVWREKRIDLVRDWVVGIDTGAKALTLHRGDPIHYDRLLLATGSTPNRFGWPGQDLKGVQGLWGLPDLHELYANCEGLERAVIVGGGLIGIEFAEMLHARGIHVVFLVRERSYWANVLNAEESAIVNDVIREQGVELRLETELKEIVGDASGRVEAVITGDGERIACGLVGLTAGVGPNIDLAREHGIACGRGVLVDWHLRASAPDVFAAGDCAELVTPDGERNLVQQVWYTGKMQGEVVGDVMTGRDRRYEQVLWYNSAKFFDLEYQTYGRVNMRVENERNLYWEHADRRHALRVVYTDDAGVIGIQTMGIRYRHRVCEAWIRAGRPVEYVLEHLHEANFDPEFFPRHEADIRRALSAQCRPAEAV